MRHPLALAALAVAGLVAAAPTGSSTDYCNGNGTVIALGPHPAQVLYVTVDPTHYYEYYTIWIYAESNAQRDLQRGGITLLGDADVCQDSATPDQGIF